MADKKSKKVVPTRKSKTQNVEELGVYVNLLTDFGFKRIFGIKEVMLHFLNTVLADDIKDSIVDLHYDNTERLGITQYDRKAIYVLICITGKGERIIVEIQNIWQEYYKDRTLFYASYLIQDQNIKRKKWDFKLQPVYSVNIVNFPFDTTDQMTEKYTSYVQLTDRDTHRVFYDKLTFVYIELPRFTKELHELKSFFEQWMFLLRYLHELDSIPHAFSNEAFEKLFEEAKIARMTKKEKDIYFNSLKNLSSMNIAQIELNKLNKAIVTQKNTLVKQNKSLVEKNKSLAEKDKALAAKDKALAAKEKALAAKDKIIAAMEKENAELRRKFGLNQMN